MPQFEMGDTVRLKSSAQQMSIVEFAQANGEEIATCAWINGEGKEENGTYPLKALVLAT